MISSSATLPISDPNWLARLGRLNWWHAVLILAAAFAIANWQLVLGRAYERWDAYDLGSPAYGLLADFIRAGRLLYWNPWIAGGSPDFAVGGSGVFSPDTLLIAAITGSTGTGFLIYWATVWLSGGIGMLLLARHLRAPVWGGLAVALGFVFSGFYTGHAEHTSVIYSASILPFIIWRFDVALTQGRFLPAAQTGVLWGMSGLAGYPGLTICTVGILVVWYVGRCIFATGAERTPNPKRGFLLLILVGAIGLLVLAPSYFCAAYEGRGYSDRSEPITRDFAIGSNALHPGTLATLSSPSVIGLKQLQPGLWRYSDVSSVNLYTGSLTLFLVGVALVGANQRHWRWFLFGIALLALACAMSQALPLRGWLYDLVPPSRYFRHASMLRGYFLFFLSLIALFGASEIEHWRRAPSANRKFLFVATLLAVGATYAFTAVRVAARYQHPEPFIANAHFILIWGSLVAVALFSRLRPSTTSIFLPMIFAALAIVDAITTSHFSEGTVYSIGSRPALLPPVASVEMGPASFWRAQGTGSNINLYFKVPALKNYAPFKNQFHEAIVADPLLRAMAVGHERIWFTPHAPELPPAKTVFENFRQRVNTLNAPVIIRHSRAAMLSSPAPEVASDSLQTVKPATRPPTRILEYSPEKLVLESTVSEDGWLMVTDRWSRSWRATVNGVPQPVWCANFIFRAVPVVQGTNRIEFSYQPFGLPALAIMSWAAIGITSVLSVSCFLRDRHRTSRETRTIVSLTPVNPRTIPAMVESIPV